MKTFNRGNLTTVVLLALTIGMSQTVFASTPIHEKSGTTEVDLSDVSVSDTLSSVRADATGKIIATGADNQNINLTDTRKGGTVYNVFAYNGGTIQLGDADTKFVTINSTGENAYGIMAFEDGDYKKTNPGTPSKVVVNGDTLTINVHGTKWAIGAQAQSNLNNPASVIDINTKNTIINASTDVDASTLKDGDENPAIGLISYSGSTVTIHNNLTINAPTAISTRGYSTVTINPEGTGTVKLNGDISFNYDAPTSGTSIDSTVNINLTNAESYLNGNIIKTGNPPANKITVKDMKLTASNGAVWNTTKNSFVNQLTLTNGGQVNLSGDAHEVDVLDRLTSNGGMVTTDSLDSQLKLASGAQKAVKSLTVKGSGNLADAIAADASVAQKLANVVTSEDTQKSLATQVTTDEGLIAGAYNGTINADGTVTGHQAINTGNSAISNMAAISLMTWRQENNDMNKRLGELRDSKGKEGTWFRMARGEMKYGEQNVKNQYNYYQLGWDTKVSPTWTVGGALTYTDGQSSFSGGNGTNKHTGFAIYGSQLQNDGSFIDLIGRFAHMKNEFSTVTGAGNGSYDTNGFSLSAEYGKRYQQSGNFWLEPQAELTYGHVTSADVTSNRGVHLHQDSLDSLVGRLGFSAGQDIKAGNIYARASYLHEFQGDADSNMTYGSVNTPFTRDLGGSWWEFGLGTNLNFGKDSHFYLDVEKSTNGDVTTPWQWNVGFRVAY